LFIFCIIVEQFSWCITVLGSGLSFSPSAFLDKLSTFLCVLSMDWTDRIRLKMVHALFFLDLGLRWLLGMQQPTLLRLLVNFSLLW